MKVLEIFGEPIINGGQEAFVINVLKNIDMKDLYIDFFTPYYCGNDYYKSIVEEKGGKVIAAGLEFFPGNSRFNIIKPLNKVLKNEKYEVVHIHSGSVSVLALASWVAYKNNIKKIVVHSHSPAEKETFKHFFAKSLLSPLLYKCPTDYLACSNTAGEWKFPHTIVKNNLRIIKNGIDLKKFSFNENQRIQIRNSLGIDKHEFLIGHVGRFSYEKNHKFMIDLFLKYKLVNNTAKMVFIGEGNLERDIKEMVKNSKLDEDVIFAGSVNNIDAYMQALDIFILPSLFEGLPLAGIEAQAAGLPVIASSNVSRELKLTEHIHFLELDNQEQWIAGLDKYISKKRFPENCEVLRKKGFDIYKTAAEIREIYFDCKGKE